MITKRLWYLASLAGCVIFFGFYQAWFSWIALVLVLGLPWLSLLLSLPAVLSFRVQTEGPSWVQMGERASVSMLASSRWPVPPFRGRLRLERKLTGETWTKRYDVAISTAHCGAVTATPEKLRTFDYLGLFRLPVRKAEGLRIIVRPNPVPLEPVPNLDGFLARRWWPKPGGGYAENHEMRLYRPGDNLNQVHWKLTAKTGDLIIREPMEPEQGLLLVTLDVKGSPEHLDRTFGQLLWLGQYLLEQELPFTICALTGAGLVSHPVTEADQLIRAMDELLSAEPAGEGSILTQNLEASRHCHLGGDPDEA